MTARAQPVDPAPDVALGPIVLRLVDTIGKQADAIREQQQTIAAQADQIVSLSRK